MPNRKLSTYSKAQLLARSKKITEEQKLIKRLLSEMAIEDNMKNQTSLFDTKELKGVK